MLAFIHIISPQRKYNNLEGIKNKNRKTPQNNNKKPKSQYIPLRRSSKEGIYQMLHT